MSPQTNRAGTENDRHSTPHYLASPYGLLQTAERELLVPIFINATVAASIRRNTTASPAGNIGIFE